MSPRAARAPAAAHSNDARSGSVKAWPRASHSASAAPKSRAARSGAPQRLGQGGHPGEPVGQHLPGAQLLPQRQARREPGGGPGAVAPVAGHEPEVVERQRGVERVAELAVHRQRVLEDRRGPRRVAPPVDRPAEDVAPHPGGPPAVAQRLEERLGLPDVDHGLVVVPLRQVDKAEQVQRQGGALPVAQVAPERQAFGPQRARLLVVAPEHRQQARRAQPPRPHRGGDGRAPRRVERALQPAASLVPMARGRARTRPATRPAAAPLPRRRSAPARRGPPAGCRGRPRSGPATPGTSIETRLSQKRSASPTHQAACARRVASSSPLAANCSSPNSRTVSSIPYRTSPSGCSACCTRLCVDQRPEPLQDVDPGLARRGDHRLGRLQGAAADEDGQPPEERLLRRASSRSWLQAMASRIVRRRAGRSRAPPTSSGSRRASRASSAARRQQADPRRRQLDGQRQPVEAAADRGDGRRVRPR